MELCVDVPNRPAASFGRQEPRGAEHTSVAPAASLTTILSMLHTTVIERMICISVCPPDNRTWRTAEILLDSYSTTSTSQTLCVTPSHSPVAGVGGPHRGLYTQSCWKPLIYAMLTFQIS